MSTSSKRRRETQGMTVEERLEVFRRVGAKVGEAEAAALRRTGMTLQQAFMASKKEKK